jgi:hypothetical protein
MARQHRHGRRGFRSWHAAVGVVALTGLGSFGLALGTGSALHQAAADPLEPGIDRSDEWPVTECGTFNGRGCAPTGKRVDLQRPTFSKPTAITNPLFPVSQVRSVIQVGKVDGKPFRSETTTLPTTGFVDWYGAKIPVVLSQYTAYLDGTITEVAIDRYAQADDGSVWYFGEDVIDYVDGAAAFTEGTWLAGRDGPPAMIMPAQPKHGDVFRVENVVGIVFEELTVVKVNHTVQGPNGPVPGAIVVDELGTSGGHSLKTLAPGYGEFLTADGPDVEAMAVATPIDGQPGGAPVEIRKALTAAWGTLEYARAEDWPRAAESVARIAAQVAALDRAQQPSRVMALLHKSLTSLQTAVRARTVRQAEQACVDLAQSAIDLEARYRPPEQIEVARFHLHTQQLRVAAAAGSQAGVTGEVAALEWIQDRLALGGDQARQVGEALIALRSASDGRNLAAAADHATRLASLVRDLSAR